MKTLYIKTLALCAMAAAMAACNDDMEYVDTTATAVQHIYEPVDGKSVQLQASSTASLLFEWEPVHCGSGAVPQYEVVFTTDGNLDNPLYRVTSDNTGMKSQATISHKVLSKIMAAAGVGSGETGSLKWGVIAYAGVNGTKSTVLNNLTITRFEGFADIPGSLYLVGAGTESGDDLSNAIQFNSLDAESFEIFTKLTAGQKIYFSADKEGSTTYSLNGTKIVEGDNGGTGVDETGVYRLIMDFSTASATLTKVAHLYFQICDNYPTPDFEFEYVGNGVFQQEYYFETYETGWSWDPFESRYKLLMEYGDGSQVMWGPTNSGEDGKPSVLDIESEYFRMTEYGISQWDQKWKLADDWYKKNCVYSAYFNKEHGAYTHFIVEK